MVMQGEHLPQRIAPRALGCRQRLFPWRVGAWRHGHMLVARKTVLWTVVGRDGRHSQGGNRAGATRCTQNRAQLKASKQITMVYHRENTCQVIAGACRHCRDRQAVTTRGAALTPLSILYRSP